MLGNYDVGNIFIKNYAVVIFRQFTIMPDQQIIKNII